MIKTRYEEENKFFFPSLCHNIYNTSSLKMYDEEERHYIKIIMVFFFFFLRNKIIIMFKCWKKLELPLQDLTLLVSVPIFTVLLPINHHHRDNQKSNSPPYPPPNKTQKS